MKVMTISLHGSEGFHADKLDEDGAVVQMQVEPVHSQCLVQKHFRKDLQVRVQITELPRPQEHFGSIQRCYAQGLDP